MRSAAKYLASLIALFAVDVFLAAQAPEQPGSRPAFEVASVKTNTNPAARTSISSQGGRFTAINVPFLLLVNTAYVAAGYDYDGLPSWSERFDVVAKAPESEPPDQIPLMLQTLLAERFKMVAHVETRDAPMYALVLARADRKLGRQIAASTTDCTIILGERNAAARARGASPVQVPAVVPGQRPVCSIRGTSRRTPTGALLSGYSAGSTTMSRLAEILRQQVRRHVVDRTGLSGEFDFDVEFAPERPTSAPAAGALAIAPVDEGPSIFTALEEQLGLKLESTRGPVEYLVIDSVEKPVDD